MSIFGEYQSRLKIHKKKNTVLKNILRSARTTRPLMLQPRNVSCLP